MGEKKGNLNVPDIKMELTLVRQVW